MALCHSQNLEIAMTDFDILASEVKLALLLMGFTEGALINSYSIPGGDKNQWVMIPSMQDSYQISATRWLHDKVHIITKVSDLTELFDKADTA